MPETARAADLSPARGSSSARCSGRAVIDAAHRYDVAVMPGCFTPTEILARVGRRRRRGEGLPRHGARAGVLQGPPRPAAAGEADADRRREPRERRRLDPARAPSPSASARRWSIAKAVAAGDSRPSRSARGASSNAVRRAGRRPHEQRGEVRHVRRDHAAAEPARVRALLSVARAAGDLRRRRSERRGEPGALRVRQPLRDARAGQSHRRRRRARAARRRRQHRVRPARRRSRSASTSPRPAPASAPSTVVYDRADASVGAHQAPARCRGTRCSRARRWFHVDRHHAGARARRWPTRRARPSRPRARAGVRVSLDLNYRAKLWGTDRAREVMRPLASHGRRDHRQRGGHPGVPRPRRARRRRRRRAGSDVAGYRDVAARVVREFGVKQVAITLRESYSASRNGWSAVLLRRSGGRLLRGAALRRDHRRSHRRRRQLRGRPHLRAGERAQRRRRRCDSRWRRAR